jgi:hypothetical protein
MKRIASESRQSGMRGSHHCFVCGMLLESDGIDRCLECRPVLSRQARDVGEARRREREEIAHADRQLENLEILIRRINRRAKS